MRVPKLTSATGGTARLWKTVMWRSSQPERRMCGTRQVLFRCLLDASASFPIFFCQIGVTATSWVVLNSGCCHLRCFGANRSCCAYSAGHLLLSERHPVFSVWRGAKMRRVFIVHRQRYHTLTEASTST